MGNRPELNRRVKLLPAQMLSEDDVVRAIDEYELVRLKRREAGLGKLTKGVLKEFIWELVIPDVDSDGRIKESWNIENTNRNSYFQDLMDKIEPSKRKTFAQVAKAIYRPLIKGSVNNRRQDSVRRARELARLDSIGGIPDRLGGTNPFVNDETANPKGLGYIQSDRQD